jgi:hypothetical protein
MKKITILFALIISLLPLTSFAKKNAEGLVPEYQLEGAGMTTDNAQQVKVSILSSKKDINDSDFGKCAVHGVLFRDYDDTTNTGYGSAASHKCIMGSATAEQEHIDFFEPFFTNGDCNNYVQIVEETRRVVKVGKQWKVSVTAKVNSSALKKDLKKQGILKNLGSGW